MFFIRLHWKLFFFFFSNTLNKFQEWWHSWDPKEVIQCEENYICMAARRDYLIHPFTPKFPTKWPFQLDNILNSSMVLHTNLSIIYLFILECSSHLLSKYHMPRPVLKHFSRSICSLFHRENWGHQNTSQEFFAFADFGPISSSPSGDLCSFSYVISLQHLNMFKYLPLKNNLKICHNNVLFSGNLLQKYSLNSYLNPFSIISQFLLVWFWSETAFTKVPVVS